MTRLTKEPAGTGAELLASLRAELHAMASPEKAALLQRFFKTGPGEYGEGDRFIGVQVPPLRQLSRKYESVPLATVIRLLKSRIHEERLLALLILVRRFARASSEPEREKIVAIYLRHTAWINNWDLVDLSAPRIVGSFLMNRNRSILHRLARSKSLWERRIAIVSTMIFIDSGQFDDTLAIAERLLGDPEDLIHKATGWMLREVGKRDMSVLRSFLDRHGGRMPRTMLRYAIERFPEDLRKRYLLREHAPA